MRLHYALVMLMGCAAGVTHVPDPQWKTVPPTERGTIDKAHDMELARAEAELRQEATSVAQAEKQLRPTASRPVVKPVGDDERLKFEAAGRVEAARDHFLHANLAWYRARLEAATLRIEVVICDRELDRARAVDRHMPSSETYELDPFRGQSASAQERWYAANNRATALRAELVRASANVTSAKEEYAQLVRRATPPSSRMELSTFSPPPTRRCRACSTYLTIN